MEKAYILMRVRAFMSSKDDLDDNDPEICAVTLNKERADSWENQRYCDSIRLYEKMVAGHAYLPANVRGKHCFWVTSEIVESFPVVYTSERLRKYAEKKLLEIGGYRRWYEEVGVC